MKSRIAIAALLGLACTLGSACTRRESVQVYTIPKRAKVPSIPSTPRPADTPSVATEQRMLGAIVPTSSQVWFFKVAGPVEAVGEQAPRFDEFVRSVKLGPTGEPTWELPEDWTQEPGSGMRYATVQIGTADQPLELTVIPLAMPDDDAAAYILSNINRWRGQLGLSPITQQELPDNSTQVPLADTEATIVNLVGKAASTGMGSPPFAGHPPVTNEPAPGDPSGADKRPAGGLSFATPAGWEAGQAGGMRKAAFEVRDGDKKAEITVIDLAGGAGDLLPNINRWRKQVGLAPITADDLPRETRPITIGDATGHFVQMIGAESDEPRQAILGAIATRGEKSWFVKLMGDADLAQRERERFEEFVKSIRFGGDKED